MISKLSVFFLLIGLFGSAVALTCYQFMTPSGFTNVTSQINPNQPNQPNQQLPNMSMVAQMPMVTCSATATACFKFVCSSASNFTARGCQDPAQPQMGCQTLQNQCPGNQGMCHTCTGNNCNSAIGMTSGFATLATAILLGFFAFFWN